MPNIGVINMDWPIIIIVILAIFLFIKIISKLVRIAIGVVILATLAYYLLGMENALIMF
jgi:hypothetical protein